MYYYRLISSMLKAVISTLGTGLYAVYKAENNANDSLGNYNGTASGGLTYTTGVNGNCFQFNGTTAMVSMSNNTFKFLDSGVNEFSIKLDLYTSDVNSAQGIFTNLYQLAGPAYYGWMIWLYNGQITLSRYNGTGTAYALSSTTLSINTQYKIVFTRKYGETKCYVNGTLVASDTDTHTISYDTIHYPRIGARKSTGSAEDWFCSNLLKLDEIYVYNRVLTSTEVTSLQTKYYPTF